MISYYIIQTDVIIDFKYYKVQETAIYNKFLEEKKRLEKLEKETKKKKK